MVAANPMSNPGWSRSNQPAQLGLFTDPEYAVSGAVLGYSQSNASSLEVPISGDTVSAVPIACSPYLNTPATCAPTYTAMTNSTGGYTVALPNGTYYLYSAPQDGYGGDSANVTVNGAAVTGPTLRSFFELSYTNSTFVLPDFSSQAQYVHNGAGTQVPILSYTSDGLFYVNSSDDLVYYSFPSKTVQLISPWEMLYEHVGYLGELNNLFYLTLDGAYAYEVGCPSPGCSSSSELVEYAVNISTGQSFTWNTGVPLGNTSANVGVNLVGRDGNDSLMVLLTANGTIRMYDPWNQTAWDAGRLSYFEANNAYWVPFLNSYIDIQADGQSTDEIEQLELEGPGSGTSFVRVFGPVTNGPGGIVSNGVNGLAFNLTLNEMAYNYGSSASGNAQTVYAFSNGILSKMVSYEVGKGPPYGRVLDDDHRLGITTGAPLVSGFYDPDFYNLSWVTNPFSGQFYDTDIQEGYPNPTEPPEFDSAAGFDGEAGHQFLNASTAVTGDSVNCENATHQPIPCPLLGTAPGTVLGTVYYVSDLPAGEFPYPASAPISQSSPPPALVLSATSTTSSVTVDWARPALYPILNYTLAWGLTPSALTHHLNLAASARNFTITGLIPDERVDYAVAVSDLNWVSPAANGSTVTAHVPPAPTGLAAVAAGATSVNLTWVNPTGPLTNVTVYYSTEASGPFSSLSEGVVSSGMVTDLASATRYYFEVSAWNSTGDSSRSSEVNATTFGPGASPVDLAVVSVSSTRVTLSWENPAGPLVNDTVYFATSPTGPFAAQSVGVVTSATLTALSEGTRYYFEVTAWNASGESVPSNEVNATTLAPPGAPTGLTVVAATSISVSLAWTNPPGPLTNVSISYGSLPIGRETTLSEGVVSSATVGGLSPGTPYSFQVAAWNSTGEGPTSAAVLVTTLGPPSPPTDVKVDSATSTSIGLSWTNPPGPLTNDTVYFRSGATGPYSALSEGVTSSAVVAGLTPGTKYYFQVAAWNSTGESSWSATAAATTSLPPPPSAPTGLVATAVNDSVIWLSWIPPSGALLNYTVAAGTRAGVYSIYEDVSNGSAYSYAVEGLRSSTTYYFTLWAWSEGGPGAASLSVNATTMPGAQGVVKGPTSSLEPIGVLLGGILAGGFSSYLFSAFRVRSRRAKGSPPR